MLCSDGCRNNGKTSKLPSRCPFPCCPIAYPCCTPLLSMLSCVAIAQYRQATDVIVDVQKQAKQRRTRGQLQQTARQPQPQLHPPASTCSSRSMSSRMGHRPLHHRTARQAPGPRHPYSASPQGLLASEALSRRSVPPQDLLQPTAALQDKVYMSPAISRSGILNSQVPPQCLQYAPQWTPSSKGLPPCMVTSMTVLFG